MPERAVLQKGLAVITGENEHRVLRQLQLVDRPEQAAQLVVRVADLAVVFGHPAQVRRGVLVDAAGLVLRIEPRVAFWRGVGGVYLEGVQEEEEVLAPVVLQPAPRLREGDVDLALRDHDVRALVLGVGIESATEAVGDAKPAVLRDRGGVEPRVAHALGQGGDVLGQRLHAVGGAVGDGAQGREHRRVGWRRDGATEVSKTVPPWAKRSSMKGAVSCR